MTSHAMLQTFLVTYRTGSQNKASEELCLTQPAISQHIKVLEHSFKKPLFKRVGKYLEPTLFAHQLAYSIAPHIDALNNIWASYQPLEGQQGRTIYLGGIAEFFAAVIAPQLSTMHSHHLRVRFEIGHDNLIEKILCGELDLAQFCSHVVHPGITLAPLSQHEYYLVGAPCWLDHVANKALNRGETETIDHIPWVAYDESLLFVKEYYQAVFDKPFSGQVALMIKDLWSVSAAVVGGVGITVLPSYFCRQYLKNKQLVILHKPKQHPQHQFYLGWKDNALHDQYINKMHRMIMDTVKTTSRHWVR